MMIRILIVSTFLAISWKHDSIEAADSAVDCMAIEEKSDQCGLKLAFFGDREVLIPSNETDMEEHCRIMYDNYFCVRQYVRNCMKAFPRTLFGLFLYDVKRGLKQRCDSTSGREAFISHISCLSNMTKDRLESLHRCKDNYVTQLEWIMENVKSEDQIIAGCCAYTQTQECLKARTSDACGDDGQETKDYLDRMVISVTTQAMNYGCRKYSNVTQCREDLDETTWRQLYEIGVDQKSSTTEHHYKSSVMVTLALLSSARPQRYSIQKLA